MWLCGGQPLSSSSCSGGVNGWNRRCGGVCSVVQAVAQSCGLISKVVGMDASVWYSVVVALVGSVSV